MESHDQKRKSNNLNGISLRKTGCDLLYRILLLFRKDILFTVRKTLI